MFDFVKKSGQTAYSGSPATFYKARNFPSQPCDWFGFFRINKFYAYAYAYAYA